MPIIRFILNAILNPAEEEPATTAPTPKNDVETGSLEGDEADEPKPESPIDEPKWKNERLSHLVIMAALPFLFFDLLSSEGRQDYVNMLFEGRLSQIITWMPFILVQTLTSAHEQIAIWVAFGVLVLIMTLEYYHHTYKPEYAPLYWFDSFLFLALLSLGIAYEFDQFPSGLVNPVTVSAMAGACFTSILVRHPFTQQFTRPSFPPKSLDSPLYRDLNYFLSYIWVVLFVIMVTCAWLGYCLDLGKAGEVILTTVIPVAMPVCGIPLMPVLAGLWTKQYIEKMPEEERKAVIGNMSPKMRARFGLEG